MKLSITATEMAVREQAPIVFRGRFEESFRQIKEIGFDGVEAHIHDSAMLDRERLGRLLNDNQLQLTSIGTGSAYGKDGIFLASEDLSIRRQAVNRIQEHVMTAKDYQDCIVIIGLIKGRVSDCSSFKAYTKNLIESLEICAAFSEACNVMLAVEVINHNESDYLNRISEGLDLIRRVQSPNLKLHIDTYHMSIEENNIPEAIKMAAGNIAHVHIADSDRWYAGHGHYDFKETVAVLNEIGYQGCLAVESLNYPDAVTSARHSFDYLNALR